MEVVLCVKGAGKELPVGFDQSNFHKRNEIMLSEQEYLAVVKAVEHFGVHLIGRYFTDLRP